MTDNKDIIMTSSSSDCPPWTDAQRDGQIEALRFAYCELVHALHRNGALDMASIEIDRCEALLSHNPESQKAARWYGTTLDYMRLKLGEPGDARDA